MASMRDPVNHLFTELSKHAQERMQEHHLTPNDLDRIILRGRFSIGHDGAWTFDLADSPFLVLEKDCQHLRNMALIQSRSGKVISIYPKDHRWKGSFYENF